MRPGTDSALLSALAAAGITTAELVRLDFASGPIGLWTGTHELTVVDPTDILINNFTFSPLAHGVVTQIGENKFSMNGSEALTLSVAIPASPSTAIAAASVYPAEYQARTATMWRAVMQQPVSATAEPIWMFRRTRTGAMDSVEISNDGMSHIFTLTVESHASLISSATGSTWLDQNRFDATDTSQNWISKINNGGFLPGRSSPYGGGGGGSNAFGIDWAELQQRASLSQ